MLKPATELLCVIFHISFFKKKTTKANFTKLLLCTEDIKIFNFLLDGLDLLAVLHSCI